MDRLVIRKVKIMAYFSNGSEGSILDEQCCDCPLGYGWHDPQQGELFDSTSEDGLPCPTALVQLTFNYDQCKNEKLKKAMTMLVGDDGICQTRKLLKKMT